MPKNAKSTQITDNIAAITFAGHSALQLRTRHGSADDRLLRPRRQHHRPVVGSREKIPRSRGPRDHRRAEDGEGRAVQIRSTGGQVQAARGWRRSGILGTKASVVSNSRAHDVGSNTPQPPPPPEEIRSLAREGLMSIHSHGAHGRRRRRMG